MSKQRQPVCYVILLTEDFNKIIVNDKQYFQGYKELHPKIAPEKAEIVGMYQNGASIFDHYGITKQVKSAFGKTVNLPQWCLFNY